MLAFNYAHPLILSSFTYSSTDDGAPNSGAGSCSSSGGANGYLCQHRWTAIAGMVGWRKSAGSEAVTNWSSAQGNRIAFGRGAKAFVVINNADQDWTGTTFTTGLPNGVYCDAISASDCSTKITVSGGQFSATVKARNSVAIHVGSMSSGSSGSTSSGSAVHPNGDTSKCIDVSGATFANGTPVEIYDCNETNAQRWVISRGSTKVQVAGTNYCLDAGSTPGDGTKMKIWECYDNLSAQQWYFTDDNRISLENQGKCLDLTDGSKANGNTLQIWSCGDGNAYQVWTE
eukprot:GHVO01002830.1.p1 GENE.GHVO01002830.1~~GHVO01002830.1.p1  ORF type:complete len:287 (-),score=7.29 GHVO01002830.1:45-905(-)